MTRPVLNLSRDAQESLATLRNLTEGEADFTKRLTQAVSLARVGVSDRLVATLCDAVRKGQFTSDHADAFGLSDLFVYSVLDEDRPMTHGEVEEATRKAVAKDIRKWRDDYLDSVKWPSAELPPEDRLGWQADREDRARQVAFGATCAAEIALGEDD